MRLLRFRNRMLPRTSHSRSSATTGDERRDRPRAERRDPPAAGPVGPRPTRSRCRPESRRCLGSTPDKFASKAPRRAAPAPVGREHQHPAVACRAVPEPVTPGAIDKTAGFQQALHLGLQLLGHSALGFSSLLREPGDIVDHDVRGAHRLNPVTATNGPFGGQGRRSF